MPSSLPRILLIADDVPTRLGQMQTLLQRADFHFDPVPMADAVAGLGRHDDSPVAAAVILADHHYFNGRQQELIHVVDALCDRHVGIMLMPTQPADQAAAVQMAAGDGLMAVSENCRVDELAGRLAGMIAARPMLDALRKENAMLRRFDTGLNTQMTQLDEEMRLAARLQQDFLPRKLPQVNGCSFHVLFRPASYVSGDIYDVNRLDENHIGFYIADAVGHGVPAALLTIFIKQAIRTKEIHENGYHIVTPDVALASLNDDLVGHQLSQCQFVTMVYGILNTQTLELQYARAGHPHPLWLQTNGHVEELEADGPLLGVFPDTVFKLAKVQLQRGDNVLMYSDGFETAFNDPASTETRGANELYRHEFAALHGPNPGPRLEAMIQKLDLQEGSLHPRDDLTAVLLAT
ncbi:MAG: SpoIIE family protein phosphatase [Phycisphaerae bacterium]